MNLFTLRKTKKTKTILVFIFKEFSSLNIKNWNGGFQRTILHTKNSFRKVKHILVKIVSGLVVYFRLQKHSPVSIIFNMEILIQTNEALVLRHSLMVWIHYEHLLIFCSALRKRQLSRHMTKPTKCVCAQRRLRWTWASAQSDQSLRCPHEKSFRSYPLSAQRRLRSDWAGSQADLSLRWAHTHFVGFVMWRLNLTNLKYQFFKNTKLTAPITEMSWIMLTKTDEY